MLNKQLIFWDTSVLLAWLKKESDKPLSVLAGIIDACEKGEIYLGCSVLVCAEILYIADNGQEHDLEQKLADLRANDHFVIVEINEEIAREAGRIRQEGRQRGIKVLKPVDSLIVATANLWKAEKLHTFDTDMLRYHNQGIVSIPITRPHWEQRLFYEY